MLLKLNTCDVRSWAISDVDALARHANNRKIWRNLRDAFPHPYTRHDARQFIRSVLEKAGYVLEARLRCSAIKDGELTDQFQYAFIADPRERGDNPRSEVPARSD